MVHRAADQPGKPRWGLVALVITVLVVISGGLALANKVGIIGPKPSATWINPQPSVSAEPGR